MKISNLCKKYGDKVIFDDFNITFEDNKVTAIMGGSGVGKTTLLKVIANLTDYTGEIDNSGEISYVFGEASLISSLTIKQNLEYAVSHVIKDKTELNESIKTILNELELSTEINSYPKKLSTGMSQRVSLARGFLYPSKVLILDEPFRGLDTALKHKLQKYLLKLLSLNKRTVILITHDINEAIAVADRVVVFEGRPVNITFDRVIDYPVENRLAYSNEMNEIRENLLNVLGNQ